MFRENNLSKLDKYKKEVLEFLSAGITHKEIAKYYNVSTKAVSNWLYMRKNKTRKGKKLDRVSEKVLALLKKGTTQKDIAKQFSVHPETVSNWIRAQENQDNKKKEKNKWYREYKKSISK